MFAASSAKPAETALPATAGVRNRPSGIALSAANGAAPGRAARCAVPRGADTLSVSSARARARSATPPAFSRSRHVIRLDGIASVQMPGVQKRLAGLRRPAGGLECQRSEHLHVGRGRPERGGRIEFAQRVSHAATDAIGHAELHVQPVCPVIRRAGADVTSRLTRATLASRALMLRSHSASAAAMRSAALRMSVDRAGSVCPAASASPRTACTNASSCACASEGRSVSAAVMPSTRRRRAAVIASHSSTSEKENARAIREDCAGVVLTSCPSCLEVELHLRTDEPRSEKARRLQPGVCRSRRIRGVTARSAHRS